MSAHVDMRTSWAFRAGALPRTVSFKRQYWEVGVPNGPGIAIVFGDTDSNARLIAAAPDLLEALKELTAPDLLEALQDDNGHALKNLVALARASAAIVKTIGGAS